MSKSFSFGKIDVGLTAGGTAPQAQPREPGGTFRVAILGDFTGRASRGVLESGAGLASRKAVFIDRDNFDEVMARLGIALQVSMPADAGGPVTLGFKELDDFRPERIVPRLGIFEKLRTTRRKLQNQSTFAEAADEVRKWARPQATPESPPSQPTPAAPPPTGSALLEQILGDTSTVQRPTRGPAELDLDSYLRAIVAPYAVAKADPRQAEFLAAVDEAMAGLLRAVLHHPTFQGLEAAWRSLYLLVRRLDTDTDLKLHVLDISRDELAADLTGADDLSQTGTYRLLVEQTVGRPGGQPWAVLQGNYRFGPTRPDVELLGRLAKLAAGAGAPFLTEATPETVGCTSFAQTPDPDDWQAPADLEGQEAWQALRRLPEARSLGLALPRFLLRAPYGKDTDPTEGMTFEELSPESGHEAYLWGNPAALCTYLLAQAFSQQGWGFRPGIFRDVDGLPLHVREQDGESEAMPCAEAYLSHRAGGRIADQGVMALLSIQGRDAVRLDGFRSVAEPTAPLAGRWQSG
jgi:type VI secretion system protein ImpC